MVFIQCFVLQFLLLHLLIGAIKEGAAGKALDNQKADYVGHINCRSQNTESELFCQQAMLHQHFLYVLEGFHQ